MAASDIWLVGDEVACRTAQKWAHESSSSAINIVAASDLAHCLADSLPGPRGPESWLISMNSTAIISRAILERFDGRAVNLHPGLSARLCGPLYCAVGNSPRRERHSGYRALHD